MSVNDIDGVLVIYTGGTVGSIRKDNKDPQSPLIPGKIEDIVKCLPNFDSRDSKININEKMIRIGAYSWKEPIDSSNISKEDWKEMCTVVRDNYDKYEGFVILHGTDTMAYTASCLSFMLDNLNKPVVITGSQKPIGSTRSDAVQNIVTAIEIAAAKTLNQTIVPEVCLLFQENLFRGCRIRKISASSFEGFDSPNYLHLGKCGEHIVIDKNIIREQTPNLKLSASDNLNDDVVCIDIFPGMKPQVLEGILKTPNLRGVVMKTFGTGNIPTKPEFLKVISDAVKERGILIVNVTQCLQGEVEQGLYDVSAGLLSCGVISGMDLTPEAALTKMFVVLGKIYNKGSDTDKEKDETDEVKAEKRMQAADMMQLNLKGEQRQNVYNIHFEKKVIEDEKSTTLNQKYDMYQGQGNKRYSSKRLEKAFLRILGLHIPNATKGYIEIKVFIDKPDATMDTPTNIENFLGSVERKKYKKDEGPENIILPITKQARTFIDNIQDLTITICSDSGDDLDYYDLHIALFTED